MTRVLPGPRQGQGALGTLLLGLPAVSIGVGFPGLQTEPPPPAVPPAWCPRGCQHQDPHELHVTLCGPRVPAATLWPSGFNTCVCPGELGQHPGIVFMRVHWALGVQLLVPHGRKWDFPNSDL